MKNIIFLLSLFISGCYLANGSPNPHDFWVKEGKMISDNDIVICLRNSENKLSHFELQELRYLSNKFNDDPINMINNHQVEYNSYERLIKKINMIRVQCYYDLGYRFKPPLRWCLAQDHDNTKICLELLKYKN